MPRDPIKSFIDVAEAIKACAYLRSFFSDDSEVSSAVNQLFDDLRQRALDLIGDIAEQTVIGRNNYKRPTSRAAHGHA